MIKCSIKWLLFFAVLFLLISVLHHPADAQYNAFKDPTVKKDKKARVETDFVAVENVIKGGKIAVGSKAFIVVLFKNQGIAPVKVADINLYPSSTVISKIALNQCADMPLAQDSQCAVTVEVMGKQGGAYRVEMLVEHDGNSRISTASIVGDIELMAEKRERGERKGVEMFPKLLDFGISPGGIPITRAVSVVNGSGVTVSIEEIFLKISDRAGFSIDHACPLQLESEENCNVIVTWKPTSKGMAQGVLATRHSGKKGMASVEIKGEYNPLDKRTDKTIEGNVEFTPKKLDFGDSPGGITMSRSVVLSNKTMDAVDIKSITMNASSKAGFIYKSQCNGELLAGENCVLIVNWKPTSKGAAQGVITVAHTGREGVANIEVRGKYSPSELREEEIIEGSVDLSPDSLEFGTTAGGIAMMRPVVLTNNSTSNIELWDINISAAEKSGFTYESKCFEFLASKESCIVMVSWKPETKGLAQGALTVHHSGSTGVASIEVSGTYKPEDRKAEETLADGTVEVSPEKLEFGSTVSGMKMVRPVTISNRTLKPVDIKDIYITASDESGFAYESKCLKSLAVDESCVVMLKWEPARKGLAQGVLAIQHSGSKGVASVEISGIYEPEREDKKELVGGNVEISPSALEFGSTAGGIAMVRPVTISNRTLKPVTLNNIDITASDKSGFAYESKCPEVLGVNGNCVVMVNWKPEIKGLAQGVFAVHHTGDTGVASIEISGKYEPEGKAEKELVDGNVEFAPEKLEFGTSAGGITMSRSVILSNKTIETVKIENIAMDVSKDAGFNYKSQCGVQLLSGEKCVLIISWKPTSKGAAQGVLTVQHSGDAGVASIEISGNYDPIDKKEEEKLVGGNVEVSPAELNFGTTIGGIAMVRPVTINNKTLKPINIKNINITASNKSGFTHKSQCPEVLGVSGKCVVMVSWKPKVKGLAQGVLAISHSGDTAVDSVEISGKYEPVEQEKKELVDGSVEFSPESLDFGTSTGGITMSRSVVLSNKTLDAIQVKDIMMDVSREAGFSYKSQCGKQLLSAEKCVIIVKWKPTSKGAAQGVITVGHTGDAGVANIEISGNYEPVVREKKEVIEGTVGVSPEALDFGTTAGGITMVRPVTISNKTSRSVSIKKLEIAAASKAGFNYTSQCGQSLGVDESCVVMINWNPSVPGLAQGVLTVQHTGDVGMASVEISGNYEPIAKEREDTIKGSVEISPESLDFGKTVGGITMVRPVTISNKTLQPVSIEKVNIAAASKAGFNYTSQCSKTLNVDESCVVMVNWNPNIKGLAQGALTIQHTGDEGMAIIEISGDYEPIAKEKEDTIKGSVEIAPEALDFGTTAGGITMVRPVTVSNKTLQPIYIEKVNIAASSKAGFNYTSQCSKTLNVDESCIVMVNWNPNIQGLAQGVLTIQHTGDAGVASVEIMGMYDPIAKEAQEVIEGSVEVAPGSLDFGTTAGGIAMVRPITIANKTLEPVSIKEVYVIASDKSGFSYKSKCPETLGVNETCVITVNWKPEIKGAAQGVLAVRHTGDTGMASVEISGTYMPEGKAEKELIDGNVEFSPETLSFGDSSGGITMSRSVVLSNRTLDTIKIKDIQFDVSKEAGFSYKSQCGSQLRSGENCVLIVKWKPTSKGDAQGVIMASHTGDTGMASIEVSGKYKPVEKEKKDIIKGNVEIAPEKLDFGSTSSTITMVRPITFSNRTLEPITIKKINIAASSKAGFNYTSQCANTLGVDESCVIMVNWNPNIKGAVQGVLTVQHSGDEGVASVEVTGNYDPIAKEDKEVIEGSVDVSPENLDFGSTAGGIAMVRPITIANKTLEPISIKEVYVIASDKAGFAYNSRCPKTLQVSESCVITVNWKPEIKGYAQGVLAVRHTGDTGMASVEISGRYEPEGQAKKELIDGNVEFSPEKLDFGSSAGGMAMSRSIVLSNNSLDTIKLKNITMDVPEESGFSYKSQCDKQLVTSEKCVLIVSWKPISKGLAQGVITVEHTGDAGIATIEIAGQYNPIDKQEKEVIEGTVEIAPEKLDFGSTSGNITMVRPITISNKTLEPISIKNIDITAAEKSGFVYKSKCAETLDVDESCVLMISWTPTVKGLVQAVLDVQHSGSSGVVSVEVSGTYNPRAEEEKELAGGNVEVAPDSLSFGSTAGGIAMVRPVTITNKTLETVTIKDISITASDKSGFSYKSQCPKKLNVNGSCVVMLSWKPEIKGLAQGVLAVQHTGDTNIASIEISGTYTPEGKAEQELVNGEVEFAPEKLDFGNSTGGITMSRSVILSNKTIDTVKIKDIVMDVSDEAGFSYKSQCDDQLLSGESCVLVVKWKPTTKGSAQGVITAVHSGNKGIATIEVSAQHEPIDKQEKEIIEGDVEVAPASLEFGSSSGGITMVRPITISNKTLKPVEITDISITAAQKSGFIYKSQCPAKLGVNGKCVVMVSWNPNVKGLAQGVLSIKHTGTSEVASVEISGTYEPPAKEEKETIEGNVEVAPESLDFGSTAGGISMVRPITISNKTLEPVTIKDISITASDKSGFVYSSKCPKNLDVDESCVVMVNWKPEIKGLAQGVLTVQHSGSAAVASIEISGTFAPEGKAEQELVDGSVEFSSETLDFGDSPGGITMSRSIVLVNKTIDTVKIKDIIMDVSDEAGFSYKTQCKDQLLSSETCVLIVSWKPTTKGLAQGVITALHSGNTGMASIEISGKYSPPEVEQKEEQQGSIDLSPENLDFGTSDGGLTMMRPVVVTNNSKSNVELWDLNVSASERSGFSVNSKCFEFLAAGESCVVMISWKPQTKGLAQGAFTVQHSGSTGVASMEISGRYEPTEKEEEKLIDGDVEVSPEALDFGSTGGGMAMVRPVTITNKTLEPVTIKDISITASDKAGFSYQSQCPKELGVNGNCVVMLSWKPEIKGLAQGVLAVRHTGASNMTSIEISGKYEPEGKAEQELVDGSVEFAPEKLDFGTSDGGITMSRSIVLSNKTIDTVKIKDILMDVSDEAGFSYNSQCKDKLFSGESCVVIIKWKPTSKGAAQGVMTVQHTGDAGVASIEIAGEYNPPAKDEEKVDEGVVEVAPESLDFGTSAGAIAMVRPVTIRNKTSKPIEIKDVSIVASNKSGFSHKIKCPKVLGVNGNCVVMVNWKPEVKGLAQGVLAVQHSGASEIVSIEISGSYTPEGKAEEELIDGNVEFAPEKLDFGTSAGGITLSRSLVLSNKTLNTIKIKDISLDISKEAGFAYKSQCGDQLLSGENCVLIVSWRPTTKGIAQGVLTMAHSGKAGVASIEISGEYNPASSEEKDAGNVEVAPENLDFGTTAGGIARVRPVTITNKTLRSVDIEDVYITASDKAGFSYKSKCSKTLGPNESCVVMVNWKPEIKGLAQGVLTVEHTGDTGMESVEISGTYEPTAAEEKLTGGDVEISPEKLDFGTSSGEMAMVRPITITNKTLDDIAIKDVYITASNKAGFASKSKCSRTLKANESCVVMVNWEPETKGLAQGVLAVHHTGGSGVASVEISGKYEPIKKEEKEIIEGSVEFAPEKLEFGNSTGGITMSRSVILSNKTMKPLKIKNILFDVPEESGFSYKSQCNDGLEAGESCALIVSWQPTSKGLAQGVLTVLHTAKVGVASLEISGAYEPADKTEEALNGNVEVSPDNLDFGSTADTIEMVRPITISNKTLNPVSVKDIYITAAGKSGFTHKSRCPKALDAGESCVVMLSWKPETKGLAQGVVAIHHSGKAGVVSLEIKGKYEPKESTKKELVDGNVEISPENLEFGTSDGGLAMVRPITITNETLEPIAIKDIYITASNKSGFSYKSKCPAKLDVSGKCVVMVNWKPETKGLAQGVLAVHHTGATAVASVEISGTYTPVAESEEEKAEGTIAISPETLDFGTSTNELTMVRPVILTNNSKMEIALHDVNISASEKTGFAYESQCSETLVPKENCIVMVSWKPTTRGAAQGALTVKHSGNAGVASIEVTATYSPEGQIKEDLVDNGIQIAPEELDFGTSAGGVTMVRPITISNKTLEPVNIKDIYITASDKSGLSYKSKCSEVLSVDGSCIVMVNWTPSVKGLVQGVLAIHHTAKGQVTTAEIKATLTPEAAANAKIYPDTAINQGLLVADRDNIDFGSAIIEESSVVVSLVNAGSYELTINNISLAGFGAGIYVSETGCNAEKSLLPGEACPVILNWIPDRKGAIVDSLQVTHDGARGILVLPIKGNAAQVSKGARNILLRARAAGEDVGEYYEDYVYKTLGDDNLVDDARREDGTLDIKKLNEEIKELSEKQKAEKELEGFTISSHSASRAVIKGSKHSIIVRDGGISVINGKKWRVAIVPTGVVLIGEDKTEVELVFDSALRKIEPTEDDTDTAASTSTAEGGETEPRDEPPVIEELEMISP